MTENLLERNADYLYFVFRVLIGLLFLLHGVQKFPGIVQGTTQIFSLMGLAAIIELIGGTMLIFGLLTKYVALLTALEMLVAYFKVHVPNGINPLLNKGEAALLFFAAFLVLIAFGSRKWALDNLIKK